MKYNIYQIQEHNKSSDNSPKKCDRVHSTNTLDINSIHRQFNYAVENAIGTCAYKDKCPNKYEIREIVE